MSTIKADTLSNLAGTQTISTDRVAQGTAAAWCNFNGTGTVAIRASFNVSSITDNGTGNYTVNFATAMPDANYAFTFGGARDTSGNECYYSAYSDGVLTTSLRVRGWSNSTVTARDMEYYNVSIFR